MTEIKEVWEHQSDPGEGGGEGSTATVQGTELPLVIEPACCNLPDP